ncbi:MAG: exodeoxyribonuclease VII large subunit [Phycisphaerales bacterium]|nr:exodeoxyribonuclease VII large subunit [Phycisphaerales bacterium]
MTRKPFDPERAIGGLFDHTESSGSPSKIAPVLGVSALSQLIRTTLEGGLGKVAVVGEISNFRAVQGHWYFTLKDATARIDAMMFRSAADRSSFKPSDGMAVIVRGEITHYPPQGRTQIQCSALEPAGAGDLDAQFRALCGELRLLGYFDDAGKVAVPSAPMCIALLTSAHSAAEADCFDAAAKTFPATKIIAVDVRVQGAQAAAGIASAIAAVDAAAPALGIEVILLVRGGGSLEDLWAFNERIVADAIFRCKTPIVTGIGHESDTSIADLIADLRAATPSRAITEVLPRRETMVQQLGASTRRLTRAVQTRLQRLTAALEMTARARQLTDPRATLTIQATVVAKRARVLAHEMLGRIHERESRLARAFTRLQQQHPANRITTATAQLEAAASILRRVAGIRLQRTGDRFESAARTLEAIGPLAVLQRGYSITLDSAGNPLRSAAAVAVGDRLETLLADGKIRSTVEGR